MTPSWGKQVLRQRLFAIPLDRLSEDDRAFITKARRDFEAGLFVPRTKYIYALFERYAPEAERRAEAGRRESSRKGGFAVAAVMTPEQRSARARKGALARQKVSDDEPKPKATEPRAPRRPDPLRGPSRPEAIAEAIQSAQDVMARWRKRMGVES